MYGGQQPPQQQRPPGVGGQQQPQGAPGQGAGRGGGPPMMSPPAGQFQQGGRPMGPGGQPGMPSPGMHPGQGRGGPPQGYPQQPGMRPPQQQGPPGQQRPPFPQGPSRQGSLGPGPQGPGQGGPMQQGRPGPPQHQLSQPGPGQRPLSPLVPPGQQRAPMASPGMSPGGGPLSPPHMQQRGPSPLPPGQQPQQFGGPGGPQQQPQRPQQQGPGAPGPANFGQQQRPQQHQMPNGGATGLEGDMQRMQMGGSPATSQAQPGPSPSPHVPDLAPQKTKRAARAYHQEAASQHDQLGPGPNPYQAQGQSGGAGAGRASPMPPRGPLSPNADGQFAQHQQFHQGQQQPHPYQNAPPPTMQHPDRPEHLQHQGQQQLPITPGGDYGPPELQAAMPQPPHSAGQRLQGARNRIDPNQIPSPVAVQEADQEAFDREPFYTCARTQVPLSSTDFTAVDQGNCNPRFIRLTTYSLPTTDEMATASMLPIGLIVQPFADLKEEEGEVPVVDFGETGPPRCKRCRGYINAWCQFVNGGQAFTCNLCGGTTEVGPEYFSNLDMSGRRMDHNQRAELCRGSVDLVVPKDYWVQSDSSDPAAVPRTPAPINYIFAIDVSWSSVRSGILQEVIAGIKEVLYGPPEGEEGEGATRKEKVNGAAKEEGGEETIRMPKSIPKGAKVCIMTFDRTVHFHNLKAGLEQAQMLVVPDLEDMFVPMSEGLLADPYESRSLIEGLLDALPNMFGETQIVEAALGGPVSAALLALKRLGGQLNVFLTSLPSLGPGALKPREDQKLWGTDKEKTLFAPADPWYRTTAEECALAGIGINLFLFPSQYIDVASVGVLSGLTGGETFFHPRFTPVRDSVKVRGELRRVLTRTTGYSVTMRIRCSNGLRVAEHFGSFFQRNITDLEFGNIDADKAVGALIRHEGKLDEKFDAHFQCALLYTTGTGERRVRCHNLAVPVSSVHGNVFRAADMDTTITFLAKQYIAQAVQKNLRDVRTTLTDVCVKILVAYRKFCASSTSPGQLILPESLKLFPLFALALSKTKALKGGNVASDVRTHYMRYIKSLGVSATVALLHPRMLSIHDIPDGVGLPDQDGKIRLPPLLRTSYMRMVPEGAYLIDNGDTSVLWLGVAVSPAILQGLYGVDSADELDTRMSSLPNLPTPLSRQVRGCIEQWERLRGGRKVPVIIARQNKDGTEIEFANMLVEDQNNDAMSYVDFLCLVHRQIQNDLVEKEKAESQVDASSIWRGTW